MIYSIFQMRDWCQHYSVPARFSAGTIWSGGGVGGAGGERTPNSRPKDRPTQEKKKKKKKKKVKKN
jgi:hypothetical protein